MNVAVPYLDACKWPSINEKQSRGCDKRTTESAIRNQEEIAQIETYCNTSSHARFVSGVASFRCCVLHTDFLHIETAQMQNTNISTVHLVLHACKTMFLVYMNIQCIGQNQTTSWNEYANLYIVFDDFLTNISTLH